MLDQVFASLATSFSQQFGGPFVDATATWPGTPVKDDGGSITTPGTPVSLTCKAQFDAATDAMRSSPDFLETDVRIMVLAGSISGALDTAAALVVASGVNAGSWELLSCMRDPVGLGYECRGRKAS